MPQPLTFSLGGKWRLNPEKGFRGRVKRSG